VEKVAKCEKTFGKKLAHSIGETVCLAQKEKSKPHDSFKGESNKRGHGRKIFKGREVDTTKVIDLTFIVLVAKRIYHIKQMTTEFHGRRSKKTNRIKKRTKVNLQNQRKVNHLNLLISLLPIAI
jgi:hypothetical protein